MIQATKIFSTILAFGLAGVMSACVSSGDWHESNAVKRNEVELVRLTHDVRFAAGSTNLSAPERVSLDRFLSDAGVGYGDEIWIDAGDGPLAGERRDTLASELRNRGMRVDGANLAYGPALAAEEARIVVGRYVVTTPDCPDWRKPSAYDYANTPSSNFGCATATNLGLMVANPRDLLEGREYGGPDTERAADAVNAYRAGEAIEPELEEDTDEE